MPGCSRASRATSASTCWLFGTTSSFTGWCRWTIRGCVRTSRRGGTGRSPPPRARRLPARAPAGPRARGGEAGLRQPRAAAALAHELVEALAVDGAVAGRVDVAAGIRARRLAVQRDPEAHRGAVLRRCQHQVQVARAEAQGDAGAGALGAREFRLHRPAAFERPLAGRELRDPRVVPGHALRERVVGEAFGAGMAEVGFRGPPPVPRGRRLRARGAVADVAAWQVAGTGLGQQPADDVLAARVLALAEVVVADPPLGVDEVVRGPVAVLERAPDGVVVVERDRVADAQRFDRVGDVARILL